MGLVDDYRTDGAVILRGVITPTEIELLSVGIDAVIDCPSPRAKVASASDDPGFFLEDFTTWREHREFGE
ncbi:MAG: phytanoyl-CoA dioxygenase, partial [Actinobacteria bacterium]|nr:phytanoyl-CoA dioxygenase [Actinomycetota bacterium]